MSTKYVVRNAMDRENTPLGVVTVDDSGIIKKYDPSEGQNDFMFKGPIRRQMHVSEFAGRFRNVTLIEKGKEEGKVEKDAEVEVVSGEIIKTDPDKQIVFGWAYVTHDREGVVNVDKSGDFADDVEDVEKTAYDYVLNSRQGDADHTNVAASTLVESIMFTPEKVEKMGIPPGVIPTGWWVGFKVDDAATWARVKSGELKAFSIHGKGTRSKVEE